MQWIIPVLLIIGIPFKKRNDNKNVDGNEKLF